MSSLVASGRKIAQRFRSVQMCTVGGDAFMTVKTLGNKEHHHGHLLNFYDKEQFLSEAVGDFLSVGVLKGEPMARQRLDRHHLWAP